MGQRHLTADRLFEVSELVIAEVKDKEGVHPYPPELMSSVMPPVGWSGCTYHEIEEATKFLIRLGLLRVVKQP